MLLCSPFLLPLHKRVPVAAPVLTTCVCPADEEEDEEEVYKMAGVMAPCGGLECMLNRLTGIKDFKQGRHLLTVSLPLALGSGVPGWKMPQTSVRFRQSPLSWSSSFPLPFLLVNNSLQNLKCVEAEELVRLNPVLLE